jgi:N-acetyl-anhydromuramyl-L-alanine amidase AmpD
VSTIPFYQAVNYTTAGRTVVKHIVIHCMENAEKPSKAVDCAKWMAGLSATPAPETSAHYFFDSEHVAQGVREEDVAWHTPKVNRTGLGFEHAGRSRQSRAEWLDEFGTAMLKLSAKKAAECSLRWHIPLVVLGPTELRGGMPGFLTHVTASKAYPHVGAHWDPGPFFPMDWYMAEVQSALATLLQEPPHAS